MTRQCGECQLCCKLLPMKAGQDRITSKTAEVLMESGLAKPAEFDGMLRDFDKPAGARCPHQRHHKGCGVYARRPFSCRVWNCRWLAGDDAADLSRPDRVHYVIDIMPDVIRVSQEGEPPIDVPAIQVWVDPAYPDAHRDPALRAWLLRRAETEGAVALIRYDERRAFVLMPPTMTADGEWIEARSNLQQMDRDDMLQNPDQWRPRTAISAT